MKNIFLFALAMFIAMPLYAQQSLTEEFNKKLDAISEPVQEIEARYWASRVLNGNLTIETLENSSKQWLGSKKYNKKLISSIKKYVKAGKKISITAEEMKKLDENQRKRQEFLKSPEGNLKMQRNAKIDAITAPVRDIQARNFALQVKNNQTTFEKLDELSKHWLGSEKENKAVLDLAKKYVKEGKNISITEKEWAALKESNNKVNKFLNDGKKNNHVNAADKKDKKIQKMQESVFDLKARYWAYRVAEKKDVTFEELSKSSLNWIGSREYNQKLINKIEENIKKGNTKPLSEKEQKKLDKNNEKIRKFLKTEK